MRRFLVLAGLILLCLYASSFYQEPALKEAYTFNSESSIEVDDRSFILEDTPENGAEETIVRDFLYTITTDFEAKYDIVADIEPHRISIESEKKDFKEGIYVQSYIVHKIVTLTEKEYNDERNPLYYFGWKDRVTEYDLTDYRIISVDFTVKLTEKTIQLGPQWGDGTFVRSYIVGKTDKDSAYKIYDFGMMTYK